MPEPSASSADVGKAVGHLADHWLAIATIVLSWFAFGPAWAAVAAFVLALFVYAVRLARIAVEATGFRAILASAPTGFVARKQAVAQLDAAFGTMDDKGGGTAAFVVAIDDARELADRLGAIGFETALSQLERVLSGALRERDLVARDGEARFLVALSPIRRADLESMLQIASRLRAAVAEPLSIDTTTIRLTCSIGLCLSSRAPDPSGEALATAAAQAAAEALRNGPGAIRAFSPEIARAAVHRTALHEAVAAAFDAGEFTAYFQPQISTDTGAVTGFEALARWRHPVRGVLPPAEFLSAVNEAGLSERLGETMLYQALTALVAWDRASATVPRVAVNFSLAELRNPRLPDKLGWELDRFDLAPDRLTVEVLEDVVAATDDDIVVRNLAAISALGCRIDLDDFGTGQAAIANIRRFSVSRIKIDRSFVSGIDRDPEQQKMVSAILSLAERLGLETLAEGIETHSEHSMLAQLGCLNVQGFAIARPMPFDDTLVWMQRHDRKLEATPKIGRQAG
jgi:diguanylate cyclase (GGDEF)-like protein